MIFPTSPLPPQCHPVFFYLFQSIISITIIIFPIPFTAPGTLQCVQKGLSKHQGEMSVCCIPCFLPKCNVGVQDFTPHYSSALQSAVPWLQISPSSCCKPFLPGGPLPWILQTPDARILASKNQVLGCTWSLAASGDAGEGNRGGSISVEEKNTRCQKNHLS